jgi:hypothetical protein
VIAGISGRIAALIAAAVVFLVLLIGWLLLISPQRSKAAQLSTQVSATNDKVAATQAYVSNPATRQSIQDLKRLRRVVPDDPQVSHILRQLTAAARASNVSITSITPGAVTPTSGGQSEPIGLTVNGHYFGLSKFMHLLRSQVVVRGTKIRGSGRLYSVDSIQFSGGGVAAGSTGGDGNVITATLTANAFFFSSTAAPPAAPVTTTTTSDASSG